MAAVFCVPFHISRILVSLIGIALANPIHELRSRRAFRRTLRRAGLTPGETDALAAEYCAGIRFRDLVRAVRMRVG
ncbi:hypothetical protein ACFLTM_01860 [Candidatus Bipolaricaulota bacterium]